MSLAILPLSMAHLCCTETPAVWSRALQNMLLQEAGATHSINIVNLGLIFHVLFHMKNHWSKKFQECIFTFHYVLFQRSEPFFCYTKISESRHIYASLESLCCSCRTFGLPGHWTPPPIRSLGRGTDCLDYRQHGTIWNTLLANAWHWGDLLQSKKREK